MKKRVNIEKRLDFSSMIGEITAISLEEHLTFTTTDNIEGTLEISGRFKNTQASRLEENFHYEIPVEIALMEKVELETAKVDIADFYYEVEEEHYLMCHIELLIEGEPQEEERECDGDQKEEKELEIPHKKNAKEELEKTEEIKEVEEIAEEEKTKKETERENSEILEMEEYPPAIEEETYQLPQEAEEFSNLPIENIKNIPQETEQKEEIELETGEETMNEKNDAEEVVEIEEIEENEGCLFNIAQEKETYGTFIVYMVRQNETINSILEKYKTTLEEVEKYNDIKNIENGAKIIIPIQNEKDTK